MRPAVVYIIGIRIRGMARCLQAWILHVAWMHGHEGTGTEFVIPEQSFGRGMLLGRRKAVYQYTSASKLSTISFISCQVLSLHGV